MPFLPREAGEAVKFGKYGLPDDKPAAWLKLREGAYLRIRNITAVTVGVPGDDGAMTNLDTVFVHMSQGGGAAFEPCATHEEAVEMADNLVLALEANSAEY